MFFTDSLMKYQPTIDGGLSGTAVQSRFLYFHTGILVHIRVWRAGSPQGTQECCVGTNCQPRPRLIMYGANLMLFQSIEGRSA